MADRPALTPDQIETVVAAFYDAVRKDPTLGPIFDVHVKDWPSHIDNIARFWRNALLREPVFHGNPMQKHRDAGNVRTDHFGVWLDLFDMTLAQHVEYDIAKHWSRLAHRIGRSLQMGLSTSPVPTLSENPC